MARNKEKADIAAKEYFYTKKKIEELRAKREEIWERSKTEKSAQLLSESLALTSKIEEAYQNLDNYAHLIVEYLYGEETENAKQDSQ